MGMALLFAKYAAPANKNADTESETGIGVRWRKRP